MLASSAFLLHASLHTTRINISFVCRTDELKSNSHSVNQQYTKTTQIKHHVSKGRCPELSENQRLEAMGRPNSWMNV